MFNIFRKKKPRIVMIPLDPPEGMYQGVWEKKRQPSPGAQAYAWESLGLPQFTPIGASVVVRQALMPTAGVLQPYVGQAVPLQGMPTTAGQIYGQPLFDNSSEGNGYTSSPTPINALPFYLGREPFGGQAI